MAAIDKVKKARGLATPVPDTPAPLNPSPATDQLSAALAELLALLPSLQSQMATWPQVISERLAAAFRTAQQQDEARQRTEAAGWKQERAESGRATQEALNSLNASAYKLNSLAVELENRNEKLIWGLSRERWGGIVMGLSLSVVLGLAGGLLYQKFGPPRQEWTQWAEDRKNLSNYRQKWDAVRPADQKRAEKRLADKQAEE